MAARRFRTDRLASEGIARLDVVNETSVAHGFEVAGPITDVVHCAGALIVGPIASTTLDEFREAMEANLQGAFLVGREAARRLGPGSSLTMISSQAGYRAGRHWGVYCAAKAGVLRLCEALAQELAARGTRVNAVCPGSVRTPMLDDVMSRLGPLEEQTTASIASRMQASIPAQRYADPEEIGNVCVFLMSALASYVSGAAIPVDGGEVSA